MANRIVRNWQIESGFVIDISDPEDENFNDELILDYANYEEYCKELIPEYLKGSYEELIMNICKDYNLYRSEASRMKEHNATIYLLIKEKKDFLEWYAYDKNNPKDDFNSNYSIL